MKLAPIIIVLALLVSPNMVFATSLQILIPGDVLADYQRFLHGRDVLTLNDFSGEGSRRDVVEVILVQQALHLGGIKSPIEFVQHDSYRRIHAELSHGRGFMSATSSWLSDLKQNQEYLAISHAIINNGEFEAGFYTPPNNQRALSAKSLVDIRQLAVLSNKAWHTDWRTLESMGIKNLISTGNWSSMVRMVHAERADILLAPFQPTENMVLTFGVIRLIPIPGIKVSLSGSRHFAVSKHHHYSPHLFERFNQGLDILIKNGTVKKAYRESGFINQNVLHWKNINPIQQ